jgi:hypothetical protein
MEPCHTPLSSLKLWLATGLMVVLGLVIMGCAGSSAPLSPQVPAPQTAEQLLSAAGFKQIFPTTPAQQVKLKNMPQKQIFMISKGPKLHYVYADANGSGCLYAGNQQNYQNFQTLVTQSQLIGEQYRAAQMEAWDWGSWGGGMFGETGDFN